MKDKSFDNVLNSFQAATRNNPKKTGHKDPYQVLKLSIYEITRRRKMKLGDMMIAVYLRGRSCQYGNPFKLSNKIICYDLNISEKTLRRIRLRLQTKGVISFDAGIGKNYTRYEMLDTVMIPKDMKVGFVDAIKPMSKKKLNAIGKGLSTAYTQRYPKGHLRGTQKDTSEVPKRTPLL